MRGRGSLWTGFASALMLVALSSHARAKDTPPPPNATVPAHIRLVGTDASGVPDPAGQFTVVVRNFANDPLPNSHIRVEFLPCSGASLSPTQGSTITAVNCNASGLWVQGVTGPDGAWTASIVGCAKGVPQASLSGCACIYADGVMLGFPRVSIADLGGCDGLGANDIALWLGDFNTGLDFQRSDYDGSGFPGANDLSIWLSEFGSSLSAVNCGGAACP